ncbi:MAG: 3-hydroxyacyl-CoA dehydrogenase NAD-binding domain-containing protein, partial [Panacagrimonas sp.]
MSTSQTVGVIGAGTMGNGIAQTCAVAGIKAVMIDVSDAALKKGTDTIAGSLERLVKKDKLAAADRDAALGRVSTTTDYAALTGCDLVIEAATENVALKIEILRKVDALAKPEAIVATNTSSISITRLAAATDRPEHFIGLHFMNPAPVMELVE